MALPQTFAVGDQVMLKSWSPRMTVEKSTGSAGTAEWVVAVVWFDHGDRVVRRDKFPAAALGPWVDPAVAARLEAMAEQGIDVRPAA